MDHGHDVNKQETTLDKSLSGYAPLHWAAQKGSKEMLLLLLNRGADARARDKHGNFPVQLATKKGFQEIVDILEGHLKSQAKMAAKGDKGAAVKGKGSAAREAVGGGDGFSDGVWVSSAPSYIVTSRQVVIRKTAAIDSPVSEKVAAGTTLVVNEQEVLAEGTVRVQVSHSATPSQPVGWMTLVTKDGERPNATALDQ